MLYSSKYILKCQVLRAYFHRQYDQIRIYDKDDKLLRCECEYFTQNLNRNLPHDLKVDVNSPLPNKIPSYRKHVLILSPQNRNVDELECVSNWQSKLDLSPIWPYSMIGDLKRHLKYTNDGSEVMVNAIAMHSGNLSISDRESDRRAHVFVIPDMKLYKIAKKDVLDFAHFLGGGRTEHVGGRHLSFADFLKGTNNALNKAKARRVSKLSDGKIDFPHITCKKDWVLICGHGQRDRRCGIMGIELIKEISSKGLCKDKNVALISHIGGHKFAGNLILYNYMGIDENTGRNKVDSLWFGRISPPNLRKVLQYVNDGKIPEEHYRGGLSVHQHSGS